MTTAPNSEMPLAHIIIAPERIVRHERGSVILKNVCHADAPRVRATLSSFGSTAKKASLAELTSRGRETYAMARLIPASVPTKKSPSFPKKLPSPEGSPEGKGYGGKHLGIGHRIPKHCRIGSDHQVYNRNYQQQYKHH